MSYRSDLEVERLSDALSGRSLDVVVSGSIGAVESVRFLRALRRLGAQVTPWLTAGGAQFVTPLALAWAAGRPTRDSFSGDASHIALADACVVAPASAAMIGKVAAGITDTPATALVTSYLGQGKPVLMLPNMHGSLTTAPALQRNLAQLAAWGIHMLGARHEEDKLKFPEPAVLADEVAHKLNTALLAQSKVSTFQGQKTLPVLVTMGTTRGYIDDVRYLSNYSSGALGTAITEELYRRGCQVTVIAGPSPIQPKSYAELIEVESNEDMAGAVNKCMSQGARAAIFAASVLDFAPARRHSGKLSSAKIDALSLELKKMPKIIDQVSATNMIKVGFKLEASLTADRARDLAQEYIHRYGLSLIVINDLADVNATRHRARLFFRDSSNRASVEKVLNSKREIATSIADHVIMGLQQPQ